MIVWELDLKIGGGFRFVLKADDDSQSAFTGVFNAPRGLVWKAWTEPAHIEYWFGWNSTLDCLEEWLVGMIA